MSSEIKEMAKGVGIDCNCLPNNLETTICKAILTKQGYDCSKLPNNLTSTIMKTIGNNIGNPVNVATANEMNELLVSENIGKIYKFVGESDGTYTNGELYQVIEEGE